MAAARSAAMGGGDLLAVCVVLIVALVLPSAAFQQHYDAGTGVVTSKPGLLRGSALKPNHGIGAVSQEAEVASEVSGEASERRVETQGFEHRTRFAHGRSLVDGGHPPGVGDHAAGIGSHPPGIGSHPPGVGRHPPGVGHHPPGVGHHPPGEGHHPPGVGHHPPCVGHHKSGGGHHPPGHGHHKPGGPCSPPLSPPPPGPPPTTAAPPPASLPVPRKLAEEEGNSVLEALKKNGSFRILLGLLTTTGADTSMFKKGTVLAPSDSAFRKNNNALLALISSAPIGTESKLIGHIIASHVLETRYTAEELRAIAKTGKGVLAGTLNGMPAMTAVDRKGRLSVKPQGGSTKLNVVIPDMFSNENVAVHGIDDMLLLPLSSYVSSG